MKYELQSGEGFNYGLGNVRASVAKKYRSIQEIQKDRSKILSEKEFEKVKEFTNNEFTAILDQAMEIYSLEKDYGIADRFTTVLVDGIKNGNFKAELSKYGFEKMDFGRIEAFLSTLKNMPTEYFEGKLQRAVKLNEFSGAIIPKNTSTKAIDILKANNIPFEFYDPEVPESRTQAINKINENSKILFQTGASVYRGRVRFKGQSSYNPTIELFKDANLSTFLHETGHVYFEIMKDLAKTNPQIQADLDTILKWQGLTDASQVKTEHHEAFARGFETYLMEGKAPSSGLRAVFARFKAWLMGIYKDFTRLNIQLTDEVRGVFDRLVASDEAIASAENQQNYEPLFIDPKTQGMTDAQAARYMEAREEAAVAAREQLNNRLMKEISREQTSWWKNELAKVREDVTQEAYTKKEYIATSVLQKGMLPDGTPSENIKLDRKEVIKLISKREDINMTEEDVTYAGLQADIQGIEEAIKSIEEFRDSIGKIKRSVTGFQETETRNIPKRYITTKISGRPIDELERQLGLGSIEEVAQKLIDTEKEYTRLTNDLKDRKDQLKTSAVEYKETLHGRVGQSLKRLPRGIFGENGLPLAMVSELFGYVNSEQLIDTLLNSPLINDYIDVQSLEIMKARHGELLTNKEMLKSEAMNAIHNDKRAELLRMELQHLASNNLPVLKDVIRRVARRMPNDTELQAWIKNVIADKKISDIRPKIYELAERKYANQAGKLLTQGKIDEAFDAKLKEYYNHELYKLASMAKEDVEDSLVKFNRFFKPDQQIGKTRDLNMVNAARSILARFGIGDSENTPDYYLETLKNYDEDLYRELNDLVGSATINAEDINSITYDEFTKVKNSVDSLWNLAKRSRQIVIDGKLMMRDEAIDQLNERFNKLSTKENLAGYKKDVTKWEKTKMYLLGLKASLRRVESWVTAMDGGNKGVFRSYIWNPIAESVYQYRGKKKEVMQKYLDVAKLIEKTITPDQIHSEELNYTFSNKASLLHALLHSGNESNLSKLLRGRGWGDAIMSGSLDTSKWDAFISRMWKEGKLTKADYDFCQGVWDLMDSIKVEAQQAHKDMYGYYFSEITANEIKTPWGNYRGGYVPAIADPLIVEKAAKQESIDLMSKSETSNMFPTTGRGFSKSRVEAYAKPLALNLGYIPSHIDKVLRFSYIEPRIKDVARIVKNSEFRDNLAKVDSEIGLSMIDPWLDRVASQRVDTLAKDKGARAIDYIFKEIRRRTGMQIMVGNVANTLQQFTGFALSMTKVKPHFFRNALWSYVRNPSKFVELISEKSEFMRTKEHGKMMEITSSLDDILLNPNAYDKARNFANKHGYFLQKATQDIVDNITWAAAYDQAISQNEIELEAVRSADSAVRETQGSFSPESVSRFETGSPFIRAFTMFYSYFNMQANLLDTEFTIIARDMGLKKGAGRALYVYTLGFMIPAVLSELIVRAVSGRLDDEDDDGYMNDFMDMFFGSQIRTAAAMVPFVGQLATVAMNKFNNKWYDDSISASPAVKMLESAVGAPQSIYKAITEDGNKKKAVKDSLMLLGMLSGLPLAAVGRPVGYAIDVTEGDKEPQNMIDYTRGLLTGK
jgi:hypothetical protein